MAYPDGADLEDFLRASSLISYPLTEAQMSLDFDGAMEAASAEFEERTKLFPFLADTVEETRTFRAHNTNPFLLPSGMYLAELSEDADAITVNGETYTLDTDVLLFPENAPLRNRPYTRLWFAKGRAAMANTELLPHPGPGFAANAASVAIKGKWGFCTTLPGNVRQALLAKGALLLAPQLALQISGGQYSIRRINFEVRYAGAGNSPLTMESAAWKETFDTCVRNIQKSLLR